MNAALGLVIGFVAGAWWKSRRDVWRATATNGLFDLVAQPDFGLWKERYLFDRLKYDTTSALGHQLSESQCLALGHWYDRLNKRCLMCPPGMHEDIDVDLNPSAWTGQYVGPGPGTIRGWGCK